MDILRPRLICSGTAHPAGCAVGDDARPRGAAVNVHRHVMHVRRDRGRGRARYRHGACDESTGFPWTDKGLQCPPWNCDMSMVLNAVLISLH